MKEARLRILLAVGCGVVMISAALVMNYHQKQVAAEAISQGGIATANERKHIKVTDSNSDGIPDWQAALINKEPIYLDATNTEPFVPPNTLTGQMSVRFFQDMMTLDSLGLLVDTKEELIEGAIKEMEQKTAEQIYTEADLKNISVVTDKEALRTYGNLVAGTIFYYKVEGKNEYETFQRLTASNNPRYLEQLAKIEKMYDDIINALLELEVPSQYVFDHLAIINSVSALRQDAYGMQQYFDDPFYTSMRYRRLAEDVLGMNTAIHNLYDALYLNENIRFAENEALLVLVELLEQPE